MAQLANKERLLRGGMRKGLSLFAGEGKALWGDRQWYAIGRDRTVGINEEGRSAVGKKGHTGLSQYEERRGKDVSVETGFRILRRQAEDDLGDAVFYRPPGARVDDVMIAPSVRSKEMLVVAGDSEEGIG